MAKKYSTTVQVRDEHDRPVSGIDVSLGQEGFLSGRTARHNTDDQGNVTIDHHYRNTHVFVDGKTERKFAVLWRKSLYRKFDERPAIRQEQAARLLELGTGRRVTRRARVIEAAR